MFRKYNSLKKQRAKLFNYPWNEPRQNLRVYPTKEEADKKKYLTCKTKLPNQLQCNQLKII